jgi:hypothetical protein
MKRLILAAVVLAAAVLPVRPGLVAAQSDLDDFMRRVLERRDDNWKKLQQYILDEREQIEIRGPANALVWGQKRDFTWYVRDGFFVRSPVRVNGVAIAEPERRQYETEYLERVKRRDERAAGRKPAADDARPPEDAAAAVAGLIRQTRQPDFISSAYFLRFKFDQGTYAFVGREQLDGHEVLRIEYYPTKLFDEREGQAGREGQEGREGQAGREGTDGAKKDQARETNALYNRLLNKVALVTLWIERDSQQIVKYTYDNITYDFLPAQWLVRVDDVHASMSMGEVFPGVWLPRTLQMNASLVLALGPVDFRYALEYHDYRQADATIRVR